MQKTETRIFPILFIVIALRHDEHPLDVVNQAN